MHCPNCNQHYDSGKFCAECGVPLVEDAPAPSGASIGLGDYANIAGDIHLTDSHNVHNEDKSVHNITNTTSTIHNITNVAAQKTEQELFEEKKATYLKACKRAYEDNVLEQQDVLVLEELRIKLNLDKSTSDAILDSVRRLSERNARKSTLNPIAKTKLKILTYNLKKNEVKALMDQIDSLEPLVRKFDHDELSRKYFLVLAALKSERCIELYETSMVDSYWKSFWSYLAYIKQGQLAKAENVLISLDRFTEYPEDNMNVLAVAGALMTGNTFEANEYLCELVGEYTPALQRFVDSLYLLLEPNTAKEMGADENTCAFYLVNFFGQKDPKAKAEEEKLRQETEKQAEAKRKAEEERKKEKEAEAKRKAEEEAELKAMEEAKSHVTYTLKLVKVTNNTLATFTMRAIMGWDAGKSTAAFNSLPQAVKTTNDLEEAKDLFMKLKKGGMAIDVEAINGLNEKVDVKLGYDTEAENKYLADAEAGNAEAQYNLAKCYDNGNLGLKKDYSMGVKWYTKAAEQGHAKSQYELGLSYNGGYGVDKDKEKAFHWFNKAAEQGLAQAQHKLGQYYISKEDFSKALYWFRKAAGQGYVNSQYKMGWIYRDGQVGIGDNSGIVTKDMEKAIYWFGKAAEQGDTEAMRCIGKIYAGEFGLKGHTGRGIGGIDPDFKKALYWYHKAAELGNANACSDLGFTYKQGDLGVPKDLKKSEYWYKKAKENGYQPSHLI